MTRETKFYLLVIAAAMALGGYLGSVYEPRPFNPSTEPADDVNCFELNYDPSCLWSPMNPMSPISPMNPNNPNR